MFNAYYEEAGREFAALYPDECSGVEVVTVPYSGYYARYLAAFMAGVGAPDLFNGAPMTGPAYMISPIPCLQSWQPRLKRQS